MGPESIFGVGMLVFTLRESSLPMRPLFMCFSWLNNPVNHYFARGATQCHFNANFATKSHKSKVMRTWSNDLENVSFLSFVVGDVIGE